MNHLLMLALLAFSPGECSTESYFWPHYVINVKTKKLVHCFASYSVDAHIHYEEISE